MNVCVIELAGVQLCGFAHDVEDSDFGWCASEHPSDVFLCTKWAQCARNFIKFDYNAQMGEGDGLAVFDLAYNIRKCCGVENGCCNPFVYLKISHCIAIFITIRIKYNMYTNYSLTFRNISYHQWQRNSKTFRHPKSTDATTDGRISTDLINKCVSLTPPTSTQAQPQISSSCLCIHRSDISIKWF